MDGILTIDPESASCFGEFHECGQNADPRSVQNGDVVSSRELRPMQTDICSTLPIIYGRIH